MTHVETGEKWDSYIRLNKYYESTGAIYIPATIIKLKKLPFLNIFKKAH